MCVLLMLNLARLRMNESEKDLQHATGRREDARIV